MRINAKRDRGLRNRYRFSQHQNTGQFVTRCLLALAKLERVLAYLLRVEAD